MHKEIVLNQRYVLPTYRREPVVFSRGRGSYIYDVSGKEYVDFFPGWGVGILGYGHPRMVKAIKEQTEKLVNLPNNFYHPYQGLLAEQIIRHSFKGKVFFANSGAEAVEGCIKLMRAYGAKAGRYKIITFHNSFHGRTIGALTATAQAKYQKPFRPLLAGFTYIPINDVARLKKAVDKKTVGILLEPIQGEGGINIFSGEFLRQVKAFCRQHDLLLGFDEVQTGMGRTGEYFCFQHYGVQPDIMMLAKGLGAGVPISALVVRQGLTNILGPGMHASTFGGGPLVCRAGIEVFNIFKDEKVLHNVRRAGKIIERHLRIMQAKYPVIKEVRGKGCMWGVDLRTKGAVYFKEALKAGLVINCTHETVLRIMPALNVTSDVLEKGFAILESVFKKLR